MNEIEAHQIRSSLAGTRVLVVGGDPCPKTIQRIESCLRLDRAIHCPTRKSDASSRRFQSRLHDPRLALVVCARGLTRTQHGADLHALCRDLQLPLLNCNHIPHPNAIVAAVAVARLTKALADRCAAIKGCAACVIGGAA